MMRWIFRGKRRQERTRFAQRILGVMNRHAVAVWQADARSPSTRLCMPLDFNDCSCVWYEDELETWRVGALAQSSVTVRNSK